MAMEEIGLELVDTIQELRQALVEAVDAAADETLRFRLEAVELELKVLLSRQHATRGKLSIYVLDAGADVTSKTEQVQTVKLRLVPVSSAVDEDGAAAGETLVSSGPEPRRP